MKLNWMRRVAIGAICAAAITGGTVPVASARQAAAASPGVTAASGEAAICPPAATDDSAAMAPVVEQMLKPGTRFSLKDIPPDALVKLAAMQKAGVERQAKDWPNLCRYAAENAGVIASGHAPQQVFLGDSITEIWKTGDPAFFGADRLDRGISGQTSSQILLRFYPDVVALHPHLVHILAGTNDVAENTGPVTDETVVNNIRAMIDMAQANRIVVVLGSIPPTKDLGKAYLKPATRIVELNRQLRALAAAKHVPFIDYYTPLHDADGGFRAALSNDGVHPNRDGYGVMRPLAERAIAEVRTPR